MYHHHKSTSKATLLNTLKTAQDFVLASASLINFHGSIFPEETWFLSNCLSNSWPMLSAHSKLLNYFLWKCCKSKSCATWNKITVLPQQIVVFFIRNLLKQPTCLSHVRQSDQWLVCTFLHQHHQLKVGCKFETGYGVVNLLIPFRKCY